MRRFSIWDITISIITLAVVCITIVPAVARLQRTPEDAKCQSNMRRWAGAMEQYMVDCDGRYPTNRIRPSMMMSAQAPLSPVDSPVRFVYSINWVEALCPYAVEDAARTGQDWKSFLKCPNTGTAKYPANSPTARVTYVFNYNLLEQPSAFIRNRPKLMMMREMDRMLESCCRPSNNTTNYSAMPPQTPFLTKTDYLIRSVTINNKPHGLGSHILFADGHVAYFGEEYFPTQMSPSSQWDPETSQWWNWTNSSNTALNRTIAITP